MSGCIAYARSGRISTSGLKSDVTIVFLDHDFLKDAKIFTICMHLRQIQDYLIFAWVFRTSGLKMVVLGENRGRCVAILTPNELVLPIGGTYVCANFGES